MLTLLMILAVGGGIYWYSTSLYSKLVKAVADIEHQKEQVVIQFERRNKLVVAFADAIAIFDPEDSTELVKASELHTQAIEAKEHGDEENWFEAENALTRALNNVGELFKSHAELNQIQKVKDHYQEIVKEQHALNHFRYEYNHLIDQYYAMKKSFFESLVVGLFPEKLDKDYYYWGKIEKEKSDKEKYKVAL